MANIYGSSGSVEGTATFSALDFPSLHFKKQIEQSNERAAAG
jgi:hypothetical protein